MIKSELKKQVMISESKIFPIVILCLLAIILYVGNFFGVNTSNLVNAVCIISFPLCNITGILMILCFFIPVNSGITAIYIFGYAALILVYKYGNMQKKMLIVFLLLAIHELVMSLFVLQFSLFPFLTYFVVLFIFFYAINSKEAIDYKSCCFAYIAGAVLLMVSVFSTSIQAHGISIIFEGSVRIGYYEGYENITGVALITDNANNIAYYSLIAIILALLLIKNVGKFGSLILILTALVNIFIAFFTQSRTWLFMLIVGFVLVLLFAYKGVRKIILFVCAFAMGAVILSVLAEQTDVIEAFSDRLMGTDIQDNDRLDLMAIALDYLMENPLRMLTGAGVVNYKATAGMEMAVHNGALQVLVCYGLICVPLFLIMLLNPIVNFERHYKLKFQYLIPVIMVLTFTQTIQFLNPYFLMLPYMVAIFYMKIFSGAENKK